MFTYNLTIKETYATGEHIVSMKFTNFSKLYSFILAKKKEAQAYQSFLYIHTSIVRG